MPERHPNVPLLRMRVSGFRSLDDVDVVLGPLNVLVGPNGAGKTSFLEVLRFLGDVARLDLGPAVEEHGTWESLSFRGRGGRAWIEIGIAAVATQGATPASPDQYRLRFRETKTRGLQREEEFRFPARRGAETRIKISGGEFELRRGTHRLPRTLASDSAGLSTLGRLGKEEGAEQVAQLASLFTSARLFDVDVPRARRPSADIQNLSADASNLAAFMASLSFGPDRQEVFSALEEDARAIVPGLHHLRVHPVNGGSTRDFAISLEENNLGRPTSLGEASFGTVRALALLAMLHDPDPPRVTCVEEIDHGLHPHALDRLVERMRRASARTQLIVSTHSPALVNRLRPEELIVCERDTESGSSRIPAISSEEVRLMEQASNGLQLGELWFSGALGGGL